MVTVLVKVVASVKVFAPAKVYAAVVTIPETLAVAAGIAGKTILGIPVIPIVNTGPEVVPFAQAVAVVFSLIP
jgi:hypothetical protein